MHKKYTHCTYTFTCIYIYTHLPVHAHTHTHTHTYTHAHTCMANRNITNWIYFCVHVINKHGNNVLQKVLRSPTSGRQQYPKSTSSFWKSCSLVTAFSPGTNSDLAMATSLMIVIPGTVTSRRQISPKRFLSKDFNFSRSNTFENTCRNSCGWIIDKINHPRVVF